MRNACWTRRIIEEEPSGAHSRCRRGRARPCAGGGASSTAECCRRRRQQRAQRCPGADAWLQKQSDRQPRAPQRTSCLTRSQRFGIARHAVIRVALTCRHACRDPDRREHRNDTPSNLEDGPAGRLFLTAGRTTGAEAVRFTAAAPTRCTGHVQPSITNIGAATPEPAGGTSAGLGAADPAPAPAPAAAATAGRWTGGRGLGTAARCQT